MSMGVLQDARAVWRTLVILIVPLALMPLILPGTSQESRCAYVLIVMAIFWITEALPLAVTALLPVVLLPLLGVMKSGDVSKNYFKDTIFLLLGGLIVAIAIEESNLHKRFALRLLLLLGVQPRKLMLGFMLSTSFLSMWITNTATTAMMTPIARALLARLFLAQKKHRRELLRLQEEDGITEFSWPMGKHEDADVEAIEKAALTNEFVVETRVNGTDKIQTETTTAIESGDLEMTPIDPNQKSDHDEPDSIHKQNDDDGKDEYVVDDDDDNDDDDEIDFQMDKLDKKSVAMVKALCLCVCYAANIGGVGTLTGTAPNVVFKNFVEQLSGGKTRVSFLSWMAFGFPVAVCNLALAYMWLQFFYFGVKNTVLCRRQTSEKEDKALEDYLRKEHRKLGSMSFAEKVVLGHFLVLVALWLTRSPGVFEGWVKFFPKGYVSDAVPAVLVALSLFVWPRDRPRVFCCRRDDDRKYVASPSVVRWSPLARKFPWGVLLLLGGGFALADASKKSGLSSLIAEQMMVIGQFPSWAACLIVVIMTSATTEVTSNTVIATLLLPILAQVASAMEVHPIYLMLPSAVASSFAFMLPVATPPNAIVFAHGEVKVIDMIKVGTMLNVLAIAMVTVAINTFGIAIFDLGMLPDWAVQLSSDTTTAVYRTTATIMYNNTTVNQTSSLHL